MSAQRITPVGKPASAEAKPVTDAAALAGNAPQAVASHAIGVLCVDDHAVLVEGLRAQFAIDKTIEVLGRLATAAKLEEEVQRLRPAVVLLDVEMPGPDAFEMARRLKHSHPMVRIIVLSAHIRDAIISASFTAGISGYFAKSDELEDIVAGIHEVMRAKQGSFVLGPKVRELCKPLAKRTTVRRPGAGAADAGEGGSASAPVTLLATLTPCEAEVLRLIGKGLPRDEIAAQLCRSVKTVDGHQDRIRKKLGISARADLMRLAIREGLASA